jgi:hypothetical protein
LLKLQVKQPLTHLKVMIWEGISEGRAEILLTNKIEGKSVAVPWRFSVSLNFHENADDLQDGCFLESYEWRETW